MFVEPLVGLGGIVVIGPRSCTGQSDSAYIFIINAARLIYWVGYTWSM